MNVYVSELGGTSNHAMRNALNRKIILLYEGITSKLEKRGLRHESLAWKILRRIKSLCCRPCERPFSSELHSTAPVERSAARDLTCNILGLELFQ
jgi:hypothetical protein